MLTIIDNHTAPVANPSRAFAEAAWAANPAIAASWWRENCGFTHSKLVYDARGASAVQLPPAVNVVLTDGLLPALAEGIVRLGLVAGAAAGSAEIIIWQVPTTATPADILLALTALEARARNAEIVSYGISDETLGDSHTPRPLHQWLAWAATAAEAVWGRKKRPLLRVLVQPLDVCDSGLLLNPNTLHHNAPVSGLELAARLGVWVVVVPVGINIVTPPPAALTALRAVATAEQTLHQAIGGQWPHVAGQPLFALLPLLQQAQAPWPHPCMLRLWHQQAWPALLQGLQQLPQPAAKSLIVAWQGLAPHYTILAQAAGGLLVQQLWQQLQAGRPIPAAWQALSMAQQHAALLAALPGIGGVVVPAMLDVASLTALADHPDAGGYFL